MVVPFTLMIIFVLLYLTFKRFDEALLIMATLPFALVGGIWLLYLLGYNLSVAGCGGFHRTGRRLGRVRRDHAAVPEAGLGANGRRARPTSRQPAGRHPRRRCAARAPQGHDGRGDPRRPVSHHVGRRHRFGSHAAHRRAHGRRHDHRAAAVDARHSGGVPASFDTWLQPAVTCWQAAP
jgi:hypothetical protein